MAKKFILSTFIIVVLFNLHATGKHIIPIDEPYFREPPIPISKSSARAVQTEWVEQKLDNFDPQNNATYKMRFMRNDEFFKPGGPIMIEIGGEWEISDGWLRGGLWHDIAKELNGQMFYPEHRYYGESLPTPDASTNNLRFLNIDQSLADLAHFVAHVKKEPGKENSKVVVMGASYAATMAAWFRQKYPHLTVGAWASSAPFNVKIDMFEYKEVVGAAVRERGGEKCYNRIEQGIKGAEELLASGNVQRLKELFRLCDVSFEKKENVWRLFSSLGGTLSGTIQYAWPGDIERICDRILNDTSPPKPHLEEYARWYLSRYRFEDDDDCLLMDYEDLVDYYQTVEWGTSATDVSRQWTYQTCTEFGWFQSSSSSFHPFGSNFPADYNLQLCEDVYGKDTVNRDMLAANTQRMHTKYGGLSPAVTNVYFTNGKIDPWRTMSIQGDIGPSAPSDVIRDSAHCQDLYSINEIGGDSPEMLAVKLRIKYLISKWLA